VFSKKQKLFLFNIIFDLPVIRAQKEKSIPRHFLDNIRKELIEFMNAKYIGKTDNKFTFTEYATYGLGFIMAFDGFEKLDMLSATPQQISVVQQIRSKVPKVEELFMEKYFAPVFHYLMYLTKCYSQVNFRLYGYICSWERVGVTMRMKIELTSQGCESKMFTSKGVMRKAFRLLFLQDAINDTEGYAVVRKDKIFPKAKEDEFLDIYIQSHALHRFKERINLYNAADRNYLLHVSLTHFQKVVKTDRQTFLACTYNGCPLGYFSFFIQNDDIVLNTFLPLTSENTPEGIRLNELLPLSHDDICHIGMDKLSFLAEIDFEQISFLKQLLIDSGIWETKLMLDTTMPKAMIEKGVSPIDQNKTAFVKNFFDKIMEVKNSDTSWVP
jgi:hypothetical protein